MRNSHDSPMILMSFLALQRTGNALNKCSSNINRTFVYLLFNNVFKTFAKDVTYTMFMELFLNVAFEYLFQNVLIMFTK